MGSRRSCNSDFPSALVAALAAALLNGCFGTRAQRPRWSPSGGRATQNPSATSFEPNRGGATAYAESLTGDSGGEAEGVAAAPEAVASVSSRGAPPSAPSRRATGDFRQAQVRPPPSPAHPGNPAPTTTVDAPVRSARMIVYQAQVQVVVNNVNEAIARVISLAAESGGFLGQRDDNSVTVRVPIERFSAVMAEVEHLGDVTHRAVHADDVSEQFNDLEIRLTNLRAMRTRLEQFLARAANVNEALAVERELQRISHEIDQIEGRMRFLAERAALSTITVQALARPTSGEMQPATYGRPELVLPFPWLQELGLPRLLESR